MNELKEKLKEKLGIISDNIVVSEACLTDINSFKPYRLVRIDGNNFYRCYHEDGFEIIEEKSDNKKINLAFYKYNEYERQFTKNQFNLIESGYIPNYRMFSKDELENLGFKVVEQPVFLDETTNTPLMVRSRMFDNLEKFIDYANTHPNTYIYGLYMHIWGKVLARLFYSEEVNRLPPTPNPFNERVNE